MLKWKAFLIALATVALSGCTSQKTSTQGDTPVILPSVESKALYGTVANAISSLNSESNELLKQSLQSWKEINSDVYYILNMPRYVDNEPVLLSEDDNYKYLRTDIYGESDVAGAIYLDYRCNPTSSAVKMIHGHNMKDGSMFAKLPTLFFNVKDCSEIPDIQLYSQDGLTVYKVFSVLSVSSLEEALPIDLLDSEADISQMAQEFLQRSTILGGQVYTNDLVILNTCWYGETGDQHNLHCLVIASRKDADS